MRRRKTHTLTYSVIGSLVLWSPHAAPPADVVNSEVNLLEVPFFIGRSCWNKWKSVFFFVLFFKRFHTLVFYEAFFQMATLIYELGTLGAEMQTGDSGGSLQRFGDCSTPPPSLQQHHHIWPTPGLKFDFNSFGFFIWTLSLLRNFLNLYLLGWSGFVVLIWTRRLVWATVPMKSWGGIIFFATRVDLVCKWLFTLL